MKEETGLRIIDFQEAVVELSGKFRITEYEFIYALSDLIRLDAELKLSKRLIKSSAATTATEEL